MMPTTESLYSASISYHTICYYPYIVVCYIASYQAWKPSELEPAALFQGGGGSSTSCTPPRQHHRLVPEHQGVGGRGGGANSWALVVFAWRALRVFEGGGLRSQYIGRASFHPFRFAA